MERQLCLGATRSAVVFQPDFYFGAARFPGGVDQRVSCHNAVFQYKETYIVHDSAVRKPAGYAGISERIRHFQKRTEGDFYDIGFLFRQQLRHIVKVIFVNVLCSEPMIVEKDIALKLDSGKVQNHAFSLKFKRSAEMQFVQTVNFGIRPALSGGEGECRKDFSA
ncbi:hypothetical protein [Victivallis lenta]|uniref:hypothetical protein n=1 Tax=Victivallis lenta TaxID=2606640 RepID=UPI003AB7DF58